MLDVCVSDSVRMKWKFPEMETEMENNLKFL